MSGTLRVTLPALFGCRYISPLLPAFLVLHPQLKLGVNMDDQLLDLVGSGFDLGIRIGALGDSGLVARQLAVNRRVLCASPDYLRERGQPQTPARTTACCWWAAMGARTSVIWAMAGVATSRSARAGFESTQGELLRDAAVAGLGIALHCTWHVHEELRAGTLVVVCLTSRLRRPAFMP